MLKFLKPLWLAIAVVTIGGYASGDAATTTESRAEEELTPFTTYQTGNEHIVALIMITTSSLFGTPELQVYTRKQQVLGYAETETGEVHSLVSSFALPSGVVKHILLFKSGETLPLEGKESVRININKANVGTVLTPDPEFSATVVPVLGVPVIFVFHLGMSRVNQNLNLWSEAFVTTRMPSTSATEFATLMRDLREQMREQRRSYVLPPVCKYIYTTPNEYASLYGVVQRWFNTVEWVGVEKLDPNTHLVARLARQDRLSMFILNHMVSMTCKSDPGDPG